MRKRFHILTFGCQMNANDSAWLARALTAKGHVESAREEADIHILNTCSVREKPEQKVYTEFGKIRLLAKARPDRAVLACVGGCVAQQQGEKLFTRSRELRLIFGTDALTGVPDAVDLLLREPERKMALLDFSASFDEQGMNLSSVPGLKPGTGPSAFVNIMRGCDNFCAYCIVPFVRGRQKSRHSEAVLEECRGLLMRGAREITLLGQNVNSFGQDSQGDGTSFTELLRRVASLPGLLRLRFMTSHPRDMSPDLIRAFTQIPVLAPHLHLPLQSGSDRVLQSMGRGYTRAMYLDRVRNLREICPDLRISTDIITGFPGETEEDFEDTLHTMREADFCASFSFVYSDRPGAKASSLPDKVPQALALERLARAQDWQNQNTLRNLASLQGQTAQVLLEGPSLKNPAPDQNAGAAGASWHGREAHGFSVNVLIPPDLAVAPGDLLDVTITGHGKHTLKGVPHFSLLCAVLCLLLLGLGQNMPRAEAGQQEDLFRAIREFEVLGQDRQRSMRRDSWENLEKRFAAIQAQGSAFAVESLFYRARSLEELGDRSKNQKDYQMAADLYALLSAQYPRHPLTDYARFNQAAVLAGPLRDAPAAARLLESILAAVPESAMSAEAEGLLSRLRAAPETPAGSTRSVPPAAPAAPPAPSTPVPSAAAVQDPAPARPPSVPLPVEALPSPAPVPSPPPPAPAVSTAPAALPGSGMSGEKGTRAPAQGAVLAWMEWSGSADQGVLTLGLAGRAKYRRSSPPDPGRPWRLRLDLFNTDPGSGLNRDISLAGLPLTGIKTSTVSGGITRVELESKNVCSYKVSVLENPYRLQVEISSVQNPAGGEGIPAVSAPAARTSGINLADQLGLSLKTIMVDAGHGGHDPGAVGNGLREAVLTLDLGRRLGAELKKQGFTVLYTREADTYLKVADRTNLANARNVDLFISLHANDNLNKNLRGLETYYLDVARNDISSQVASRENGISINETSSAQIILSELSLNDKKEESLAVARLAHRFALERLKRAGFPVRNNGVRSALLHVLAGARMPSILVEMGYISNNAEAAQLKDSKYLQALAEGICEGVTAYRAQVNSLGRKP